MSEPNEVPEVSADSYEAFYRQFDSPLMRTIRREAYGEDIGQHSWVRADELRQDIRHLALTPTSRLVDFGCGACGPLTFVLAATRCAGTGVDASASALRAGRARAESLGVSERLAVVQGDLDTPLHLPSGSFDAAMALDVVLHLRNRAELFRQVASLLRTGGRFLLTDAGVVTGSVSSDEIERRSRYGFTQFVPRGCNEVLLESAGFRIIHAEDRTASVVKNAGGRLAALEAHRAELEAVSSAADLDAQERYHETVVDLAQRGALSRFMYVSELLGAPRA